MKHTNSLSHTGIDADDKTLIILRKPKKSDMSRAIAAEAQPQPQPTKLNIKTTQT